MARIEHGENVAEPIQSFPICISKLEFLDLRGMKFDPESERLPELKQYQEMIMAIRRYIQGADGVLDLLQKLSVES